VANHRLLSIPIAFVVASMAPAIEADDGIHVDAGGYVDGRAVAGTEDGTRQRPGALLDLRLDATARRWLRGHLELRSRAGGTFEGGHPGIYNLIHTFQNRSPSLEFSEAYADVRFARADSRAGIQKVIWGKLDGIPPTDVVNPRDYHDPLVDDFEERKIGIPALSGSYYAGDLPRVSLSGLRATLTYIPIAVPPRLALIEERWFPRSIIGRSRVVIPQKEFEQAINEEFNPPVPVVVPSPVRIPINFRTANRRPPKELDAGGVALRLGGTCRGLTGISITTRVPRRGPTRSFSAR
jgi:hypothetical protein